MPGKEITCNGQAYCKLRARTETEREPEKGQRESERLVRETDRTPQRGRDGQRDKQTNEDRHAETCTFILMPFQRQPKMFYLCQIKFGEVEGRASNNALWSSNSWPECGIGSPVLSGMKYGYTYTVQRPSRKREETIASLSNCRIADTTFFLDWEPEQTEVWRAACVLSTSDLSRCRTYLRMMRQGRKAAQQHHARHVTASVLWRQHVKLGKNVGRTQAAAASWISSTIWSRAFNCTRKAPAGCKQCANVNTTTLCGVRVDCRVIAQ